MDPVQERLIQSLTRVTGVKNRPVHLELLVQDDVRNLSTAQPHVCIGKIGADSVWNFIFFPINNGNQLQFTKFLRHVLNHRKGIISTKHA